MLMILEGMFIDYMDTYVISYALSHDTLCVIDHNSHITFVMMT